MRIKNQELMLELDIALAGLELPNKPQTEMTSEEKFEYILSLIKPNVKKMTKSCRNMRLQKRHILLN